MLAAAAAAFGPYLLDSRTRSLSRGGEPVGLSQYEYEVLHLLVRCANVVLSRGRRQHLVREWACYLGTGDRDAAGAAFREAVARAPRHPMAHAGLAIVDDRPLSAALPGNEFSRFRSFQRHGKDFLPAPAPRCGPGGS